MRGNAQEGTHMRVHTDRYGNTRITHVVEADAPAPLRTRVVREMQARVGASTPALVDEALEVITAHNLTVEKAVRWATRKVA